MKISLMGYMGSGKSTIGSLLATEFNQEFLDLDQYIQIQTNSSIPELFGALGEIKFRKLEKDCLNEVLGLEKSFILSLGGGTPVYYDNMAKIKEASYSVYLRLSPSELANRLKDEKVNRPLIARIPDEDLPEFIAKHLFERSQFYNQADLILDVKNQSEEEIFQEIKKHLLHRPK